MTDTEEKDTGFKERLIEATTDPESPLFGCTVSNFAGLEGLVSVKGGNGMSVLAEALSVMITGIEEKREAKMATHVLLFRMINIYQDDLSPETLRAFKDMMGKELTPSQKKWVLDEARRLGIVA